jgi:transcriptional regulator with XRE-family HTH domain
VIINNKLLLLSIIYTLGYKMNEKNKIGEFIKTNRKSSGLNQSDLAEISGITAKALSGIENSQVDPKYSTVMVLLENLGYKIKIVDRVSEQ